MGVNGTNSQSFIKYPSNNIVGWHDTKQLHKIAALGTAHLLWKVLLLRYRTFKMGDNITCTINCNNRIAATLYTLETWFVSGSKYPAYKQKVTQSRYRPGVAQRVPGS